MPPPITSVTVRDFQSLAEVEVPVGTMTCLVGPSNVGKSAFVRAVRAAARNASSTGLVRTGAKDLSVTVEFASGEDPLAVTLVKGPRKSEFRLQDGAGGDWLTAKAGKDGVPPDVATTWSLPDAVAGLDLTFAGQHDAPFLLAAAGSVVDAAVGRLTNAHRLTAASREARRRADEAERDAKARDREVEEATAALREFTGMRQRAEAAARARALHEELLAAAKRRDRLERVLDARDHIVSLLPDLDAQAAATGPDVSADLAALVEAAVRAERLRSLTRSRAALETEAGDHGVYRAPDVEGLAAAQARRDRLAALLNGRGHAVDNTALWERAAAAAGQAADEAHEQVTVVLAEAGNCPTCGQEIH